MARDQTAAGAGAAGRHRVTLPPDMLANIHGRLSLLDRLAFAAVFREGRDAFKPEAPCLILPGETPETVTLFTLADRRAAAACAPSPALRDYAILGSSRGWLATADARGQMRLVNPVTGEQRALPPITTIPSVEEHRYGDSLFVLHLKSFAIGPPYADGYGPHSPLWNFCLVPGKMRTHLYRKIVFSDFPGGAAMLITGREYGVAAFATADEAAWKLAPSREGVEDAVHRDGGFYSVTCSGAVEVWKHDAAAGEFRSAAVAPSSGARLSSAAHRKYLVVAPSGRLMMVLKGFWKRATVGRWSKRGRWACSFKVLVLDGGQWRETDDIGDAALLVGANESLCVSTMVHPEFKPGRVYYIEDDLIQASPPCEYEGKLSVYYEKRGVGVFCLKDGTMEDLEGLAQLQSWPPPAWLTPSIP